MACNKLLQEAFNGIDFRYKLDDTLADLNPKQKFSPKQLGGYLLKKGVSPKEIEQSGIMNSGDEVVDVMTWTKRLNKTNLNRIGTIDNQQLGYSDITLGGKGQDTETYRETLSTIARPAEDALEETHFAGNINKVNTKLSPEDFDRKLELDARRAELQDVIEKADDLNSPEVSAAVKERRELGLEIKSLKPKQQSLLGWRRTHEDTINGKPTTVLNEFQSDWMQAERSGRGRFKSTKPMSSDDLFPLRERRKEVDKEIKVIKDGRQSRSIPPEDMAKIEKLIDERLSIMDKINKHNTLSDAKVIADFPMTPKKHHQFQIVSAIDEAIKNGTNRVAIPIQRENELVGTEGVTKFYDSLNQSILPDIKKKLEKQGLRLKLGKEDYAMQEGYDLEHLLGFLELFMGKLSRAVEDKVIRIADSGLSKTELAEEGYAEGLIDLVYKGLRYTTKSNPLHVIEIEHIPGTKVNWDMYSVLGGIGLTGLADKLKEQESVQSE